MLANQSTLTCCSCCNLQCCGFLWLPLIIMLPGAKVNFARVWCITNPTPTSLGYLTLKRWHGKIWPQLRGLPGVADRITHLEGWPSAVKLFTIYHLSQSCTTWVSLLRLDKLLLFLDMSAWVPNAEASWWTVLFCEVWAHLFLFFVYETRFFLFVFALLSLDKLREL